ncbi:antitoxin Xre/MbcA/ParS toxin-binding domain-containing protein [Hymenobacter sp. GOD-10R]|jgi:putative toxin-antitoxin system antitoxin component (TIGR02293 family)|uniref:type II RES/Xre toxin-antitoxin system antitoxin n=1 Tax=Hymenobacter sp. GOD-10R TaxID=3093922 RepID=UPI002D78272B|nr:antitoxin Xre/MbcA/ParS toxin-binding domain-containing protein [Hymenobacter sp. GOD-10R]WRQ31210.1 antitoxin Xre/MbcA/ParS toxin-binding domain-containing protein [Hymenobacter sp. GOD-10R]
MTAIRKTPVATMVELMGGGNVIPQLVHNELDLLMVAVKGLSVQALRTLQRRMQFSNKEISELLSISESTLARREQSKRALTRDEAEKTIQLSAVMAKGLEVFEDEEDFRHWLETDNVALGGIRPKDLLTSAIGRDQVRDLLGRIQYGIYS